MQERPSVLLLLLSGCCLSNFLCNHRRRWNIHYEFKFSIFWEICFHFCYWYRIIESTGTGFKWKGLIEVIRIFLPVKSILWRIFSVFCARVPHILPLEYYVCHTHSGQCTYNCQIQPASSGRHCIVHLESQLRAPSACCLVNISPMSHGVPETLFFWHFHYNFINR